MAQNEFICEIKWCRQDLIDVLIDKDIDFDDVMIDKIADYIRKPLCDRSIEKGWEIMSILVDMFMYDQKACTSV